MKPYRTSFLSMAALLMLLCSLYSRPANATCQYFTVYTQDTGWVFTSAIGTIQSRTLTIENTSDSDLTLVANTGNSTIFGLSWTEITLRAHDTTSLTITFKPLQGAATYNDAILTISKHGTDCRWTLDLHGTATGGNSGGGDKVVTLDPSNYAFGPIAAGTDTCHAFYLVNHTGMKVIISSLILVGTDAFSISPAFNGGAIDSDGTYRFTVCFKGSAANTRIVDSIIAVCMYGGAAHTVEGQILGYTSAPPPPVVIVADPHEFNFGDVAFGTSSCQNIIIKNESKANVVIRNWTKCDNTDFTVTPAFTSNDTLAPGTSMTLNVCYKPHEANIGQASCTLAIGYIGGDPISDGTISVPLYGNSIDSNNTIGTICLKTEQGDGYNDPIVVGTTANHTLVLINNSDHSITVNSATITGADAPVFTITSSFPIVVPANSNTTTLDYSFSPTSKDKFEFAAAVTLALSGDSLGCHSVEGHLVGFTAHSGNSIDSIVRPIFSNDRVLAIKGSDNHAISETFYFTNNLQVDATVKNISVDSTQYFQIASTNPTPTPFVLHPGQNLTVVITFIATDHHVHHAHLIIDADHNLQSPTFELQGLNDGTASVSGSLPADIAISVSPNPATDYITVVETGVNSTQVEMYDLLGKSVASTNMMNSKISTENLPAGSYIIRIAGISTNGEQFVTSKRIIIAR